MARALHGEVTLGGPQHRVVRFQRGTVERISGTAITVRSRDGFVATYAITPDTTVREKRQRAQLSDVQVADRVRVVARKDGDAVTANRIVERPGR